MRRLTHSGSYFCNFTAHEGESAAAPDTNKCEDLAEMKKQLLWLEGVVQQCELDASAGCGRGEERARGRSFGLQACLCHNDLLSGNILRAQSPPARVCSGGEDAKEVKEEVVVHLIDYEYAAYNYRAFDFANHFSGEHN